MKALDFLLQFQLPPSIEKPANKERPATPPSKSEVRRWFDQNSVRMNGESVAWNEEIDFPIISLVLFPKSEQRRTTLW